MKVLLKIFRDKMLVEERELFSVESAMLVIQSEGARFPDSMIYGEVTTERGAVMIIDTAGESEYV
jgi:hypothetical protein